MSSPVTAGPINGHLSPDDIMTSTVVVETGRHSTDSPHTRDSPMAQSSLSDTEMTGRETSNQVGPDQGYSDSDESTQGNNSEDADFDMQDSVASQQELQDGEQDRESSPDSSRPSKRKVPVSERDYIKANPELYGLRRSNRARETRKMVDSDDSNSDDDEPINRRQVKRRRVNTSQPSSKRGTPVLQPSTNESDSDSDTYGGARAKSQLKKARLQREAQPGLALAEKRWSSRRAAQQVQQGMYEESGVDDEDEADLGSAYYVADYVDDSPQKPVNLWKPDPSSSASAAAVLAKNYKMSPLWEPSAQSDGQKAALLAVGSAGAALKSSTAHSGPSQGTWGNSAAVKAFHANRPSDGGSAGGRAQRNASAAQASDANQPRSPKKDERAKIPPGSKSLAAAKGAMNRPVSVTGLKDVQASEASAAASALNGATLAHRQSIKQQTKPNLEDVGAVSVTTMTRNMFTANPPVKPEVDERTYNEKIHQSAVEMAKKMYARQQITAEQTKCSQSGNLDKAQPNQYLNLQDAAYKQAQARLAKLHDEYQQGREMQEYYGKEQTSPKRRSSIINKLRRRGSDSDGSLDDRQQSERIREQMSMFSSKLSQVDKEKRDKDREALMAAAQRNVKARLHGMDEKVYQDTGRATSSSLMTDWEAKAHKAAQTLHVSHADKNKDKVDIGGGMFMTQEEINAIASKRIQPVLDDIKDKAETERERQEVLKLEEQARREEAEKQKLRDREAKEIVKKSKEQDKQEEKAKKLQGKLEEKQRKDDERAKKEGEKAAKAEQKRLSKELAKEDKRKSKLGPVLAVTVATSSLQEHQADNEGELHSNAHGDDQPRPTENVHFVGGERPTVETNIESAASAHQQGEVQSSPTAKVKGWIKTRFSRGKSFGEHDQKRRSFFGGASMKDHATAATGNGSVGSIENRSSSMHDVALAGKADEQNDKAEVNVKDEHGESAQHFAATDSRGVSPVSTSQDDERELGEELQDEDLPQKKEEDRQSRKASMAPPRPIEDPVARTSSSPTRDSRFREEMDQ